jgi:hypothetical protein
MKNKNTAQQRRHQYLLPTYRPSYLPTSVRIFVPTSCSCDSCRSCGYPPPEVSPPLSGVCARLVPSSLLFFSFVFFFFCLLNSNSGAASFSSSSSSPVSASFYFMCFDKESRPREAPQVVPPALSNCGCFPEPRALLSLRCGNEFLLQLSSLYISSSQSLQLSERTRTTFFSESAADLIAST